MDKSAEQNKTLEGENLRRLLAGLNKAKLAREYKLNSSMIGQQMRGERPISLHYARTYAAALGKGLEEISPYWAEQLAGEQKAAKSRELSASPSQVNEASPVYGSANSWPFDDDLLPLVLSLTESQRQEVQGALRLILAQFKQGEEQQPKVA